LRRKRKSDIARRENLVTERKEEKKEKERERERKRERERLKKDIKEYDECG